MIVRIAVTIGDADNEKATAICRCLIPDATTIGEVETDYVVPFFEAFADLLNGEAVKVEATLELPIDEYENYTSEAAFKADVQETALFTFRTSAGHTTQISIPCLNEFYIENGGAGKTIDLTNFIVQTFVMIMTEDLENGGVNAVDVHGDDLTAVISAVQSFKGRKKNH